MCSICGLIDFENQENVKQNIAEKMGLTMKHRGPDQTNTYISKNVIFHHNRLAVIDVENGIQPMSIVFEGKKYIIVYNGEIYNTQELKNDLIKHGVVFKTNCDTEVVLYSYIIYGTKCPEYLNGIFAFCVFDEQEHKLFLARDRFGIKPFFYTIKNSTFMFASEIKALLAHPEVDAEIDIKGLWELLFLTPVTINGSGVFRNIHELQPAECAIYDKDGLRIKKYWQLEAKEYHPTSKEAADNVRELMEDAIKRQLVSDVPLCTFLSGGVDSSIITSIASKEYEKCGMQLSTYSFEYEGNKKSFKQTLFQPQKDDEYAVYLADWLCTDHTILTAPTDEVAKCLIDATAARDIPGQADIDSSLLYFCSKVKDRHTVAISGECADEIFAGYPWFYKPEMLYRDFFPWIHEPFVRTSLFDDSIVKAKQGYEYISEIYKNTINECPVLDTDSDEMKTSRIATCLSVNYFMTSLLERKDRMSMASGLEVRVPFADHRILEYVYNVPWEIKFENGIEKALLRNAMKEYLPEKILNRKKSPYPKTHNPQYEKLVLSMLSERLNNGSILEAVINKTEFNKMLNEENATWFGQLMGKPQLIAWLVQLDYWLESNNVKFII
ncbi:MAG: asparagine synthase (glutamine-hydrolyzing) [Bacillota bacterium]|nr:asparagine synthase (glutamine-hydrolyzing) [Bacillota bacterium]